MKKFEVGRNNSWQNSKLNDKNSSDCSTINVGINHIISSFDLLCDDTFANVISHLEFGEAVLFGRCVTKKIRRRIFGNEIETNILDVDATISNLHDKGIGNNFAEKMRNDNTSELLPCYRDLWKAIYKRHNFAPPENKTTQPFPCHKFNYLKECRYKRTLLRNLFQTKTRSSKDNKKYQVMSCFSLPNRYFSFLPITPTLDDDGLNHDDHHIHDYDPPPVDFACTSYILTSSSTSSELVLLDPFDGTISVYDDESLIPRDTIQSDEALLERAMGFAASAILRHRASNGRSPESGRNSYVNTSNGDDSGELTLSSTRIQDEEEASASGAALQEEISRSILQGTDVYDISSSGNSGFHNNTGDFPASNDNDNNGGRTSPREVLFGVEDYFRLNLSDYFSQRSILPASISANDQRNNGINGDEDEIIVDWLGIDSHLMVDPATLEICGTMIGAARILTNDAIRDEDERVCTEILGWKKLSDPTNIHSVSKQKRYEENKYVCRVHGSPYFMEICPVNDYLYASFPPDEGPFPDGIVGAVGGSRNGGLHDRRENGNGHSRHQQNRQIRIEEDNESAAMEIDGDEDVLSLDDNGNAIQMSCTIVQFPLLPCSIDMDTNTTENKRSEPRFFPVPESGITCNFPVSNFAVDPTGRKLLVGTDNGTIEIWNITRRDFGRKGNPTREQIIDMCVELRKRKRTPSLEVQAVAATAHVKQVSSSLDIFASSAVSDRSDTADTKEIEGEVEPSCQSYNGNYHHQQRDNEMVIDNACNYGENFSETFGGDIDGANVSTRRTNVHNQHSFDSRPVQYTMNENFDMSDMNNRDESIGDVSSEAVVADSNAYSLPQCKPWRRISGIIIPRHLPIERAGFVILQHHRTEGTTLSLWQQNAASTTRFNSKNKNFQVQSLINLPLSPQRKPQVAYDGKRLIVFGQDHIGLIILVYHVLSSWEDKKAFEERASCKPSRRNRQQGQDSGGVINLSSLEPRIQYVNRIRHAGLGGLEYYDNMFMTANERYIIVNTKTGNLIGGDGRRGAIEGLFVIDLEEHLSREDCNKI